MAHIITCLVLCISLTGAERRRREAEEQARIRAEEEARRLADEEARLAARSACVSVWFVCQYLCGLCGMSLLVCMWSRLCVGDRASLCL